MKVILIVLSLTITSHLFAGSCGFDTRTTPAEAQKFLDNGVSKCEAGGAEYADGKNVETQYCRCFKVNKEKYIKIAAKAENKSVTSVQTPDSAEFCNIDRVSGKPLPSSEVKVDAAGNIINKR